MTTPSTKLQAVIEEGPCNFEPKSKYLQQRF